MRSKIAWGALGLVLVLSDLCAAGGATETSHVRPPQRRAFFGELHLHTALSLDAWSYGTKLLPDGAYRFGRGETVMVPAVQVAAEQGGSPQGSVPARRAWPLDFMAVTDHSENLGTMLPLEDQQSAFSKSELGKTLLEHPARAFKLEIAARRGQVPMPPELHDPDAMRDAWQIVVKAANDNYEPGRFTTFLAYEWSSLPNGRNLHRNVIFNADHAPLPFTADQSTRAEDLWSYLDSVRAQGIDVIAIPHNGNASGGLMYDWNDSDGKPIDEAYAQRRAMNEPLTEIVQIKGQSDTVPALSPNDEFADFEIYDHLLASPMAKSAPEGSYVRDAFGRGLVIQARVGANPFKYGVVGGADIHNALSTSSEDSTAGGQFGIDPNTMLPHGTDAERALGLLPPLDPETGTEVAGASDPQRRLIVERSSAGLTGVWAEENTRDSIFAALKRKETFATSGSRIRVRMFGGWRIEPRILQEHDWVEQAYARGVPMGGDLPVRPRAAAAPTFILQASRDPEGANLDRIQIIKIWLEGGHYQERIFDVAVSDHRKIDPRNHRAPPLGTTVDLANGRYTNSIGAPVLTALWRDPDFEIAKPAVYYSRVLEIPTPRWSTLLAIKNHLRLSPYVAPTIQERAWSSPIWYTPAGEVAGIANVAVADPPKRSGSLVLTDCRLPDVTEIARCGVLVVPENPNRPDGRRLHIGVAVIPATQKAQTDPLVPLMGGPGEDSISEAADFVRQFASLRKDHDILLVDQRGTGRSNSLHCDLYTADDPAASLRDLFPVAAVKRCERQLSARADLTQYTYMHFAGDLEQVRRALGYGKMNLVSGSYGTRAAQVILRAYPQSVRTAYLGSVVPIDVIAPLTMAKSAQAALENVLKACATDSECNTAFPNLRAEFDAVAARLDTGQVRVAIPGHRGRYPIDRGRVMEWFRSLNYRPRTAVALPWMIHRASMGDYSPIVAGILANARDADKGLSFGLFFSITCNDDVAFIRKEDIARESNGTWLGDYRVRQQQAACKRWPKVTDPTDYRVPLRSDVPTLFVSGDMDSATPLWMTAHAAPGFSNRMEVVLGGKGHTDLSDCIPGLYEQFVRQADARGLDASACKPVARPPFTTK